MAENTRNPPHQPSEPSRQAPGQQQKQAETRKPEPGHNPGGQADKTDKMEQPKR
jgi:hypothetical protein